MSNNDNYMPVMNDGRFFTDYRPTSLVTRIQMKQNNVSNSYDYKKLLVHNGQQFRQMNYDYYKNK